MYVATSHHWNAVCFQTMKDLNCVSQLMDSCTEMDLGSDLQTSKLLEHFNQAGPHFIVSPVTLMCRDKKHCQNSLITDEELWSSEIVEIY